MIDESFGDHSAKKNFDQPLIPQAQAQAQQKSVFGNGFQPSLSNSIFGPPPSMIGSNMFGQNLQQQPSYGSPFKVGINDFFRANPNVTSEASMSMFSKPAVQQYESSLFDNNDEQANKKQTGTRKRKS